MRVCYIESLLNWTSIIKHVRTYNAFRTKIYSQCIDICDDVHELWIAYLLAIGLALLFTQIFPYSFLMDTMINGDYSNGKVSNTKSVTIQHFGISLESNR